MGPPSSSMQETPNWGLRFMGRCRLLRSPFKTPCTTNLRHDMTANGPACLERHAKDCVVGILSRSGDEPTPGQFVASMSLGFWVRLVGRAGSVNGGCRANYDRTLWRPALHRAFPGHNRTEVQRELYSLRGLRIRIVHHEPIFNRDLNKDHDELMEVMGWIDPTFGCGSSVPALFPIRARSHCPRLSVSDLPTEEEVQRAAQSELGRRKVCWVHLNLFVNTLAASQSMIRKFGVGFRMLAAVWPRRCEPAAAEPHDPIHSHIGFAIAGNCA